MKAEFHLTREDIDRACREFVERALRKSGVVPTSCGTPSYRVDCDTGRMTGATIGFDLEPPPIERVTLNGVACSCPPPSKLFSWNGQTGRVQERDPDCPVHNPPAAATTHVERLPCNVPGCGESGLCDACVRAGAITANDDGDWGRR